MISTSRSSRLRGMSFPTCSRSNTPRSAGSSSPALTARRTAAVQQRRVDAVRHDPEPRGIGEPQANQIVVGRDAAADHDRGAPEAGKDAPGHRVEQQGSRILLGCTRLRNVSMSWQLTIVRARRYASASCA